MVDLARLPKRITVLFLAANPLDQGALRLDEEHRTIVEKIRAAEYRDAITFVPRLALRPDDLQQALNEFEPTIVHFSGHGDQNDIVLQGADGNSRFISKAAMAATLGTFSEHVRVVVFNSCQSAEQSTAFIRIW